MSDLIPVELLEQIEKGGCVLFLGWSFPEISQGILTDTVLADRLRKRVQFNEPGKTLDEISEYFEAEKGRQALITYVCDVISEYDQPPEYYKLILNLPFNVIVSTSLDTYIKEIFQEKKKGFIYVTKDEEIPFIEENKEKVLIVKLYGDIDNRSSIIITKDDHISFFDKFPSLSDLLKFYFSTKTLVFVGYNLNDPHFSQLYAYTNQRTKGYQKRAFAIVPNASDYQKTVWSKKNLNILDIPIGVFSTEVGKNLKPVSYKVEKSISISQVKPKSLFPYKFLHSFDEEDAEIFFGRKEEIEQTIHKLLSSKLMILFAKSGFGKTSLINAGITPILWNSGYLPVYARCSSDPLVAIKANIIDRLTKLSLPDEKISCLKKSFNLKLSEFIGIVNKIQDRRLIVFLDQFEEFFISLGEETKNQFIKELSECIDSTLDVSILLSLREDFLPDLQDIKQLRDLISDTYRLKALNPIAAHDAIIQPAQKFNISVESTLVEVVIKELTDKGQIDPAQLQIVCDRLYKQLPKGSNNISMCLYEDLGGVRQILSDYLDEILFKYGSIRMPVAQKILRNMVTSWFTRIPITYSEAVLQTSNIPNWSEKDTKELLSDLIKDRLIRRTIDSNEEAYELTHEYLINKIREWIDLEQLKVKEAQDLLRQHLNNWQRHKIEMSRSALEIIDIQREKLILDNKQRAFILIASTQYDYNFEYWLKTNLDNPIAINYMSELLNSNNLVVRNLSGVGLSALSPDNKTQKVILRVYKNTANPHVIKRISELINIGIRFPDGFVNEVQKVIDGRFLGNMVLVPAGEFLMGTDKETIEKSESQLSLDNFSGQYPQRNVWVDEFRIDKFLVTKAEYKEYKPDYEVKPGQENFPATDISYYEALEYAKWIGKDLPNEEEWEKAARGVDGRNFPWGNDWDVSKCNTKLSGHSGLSSVNKYPKGESPYGCLDMSGNVWEWTSSWHEDYKEQKVVRGGSWSEMGILPWCWYRFRYGPNTGQQNVGFRCIIRSNLEQ